MPTIRNCLKKVFLCYLIINIDIYCAEWSFADSTSTLKLVGNSAKIILNDSITDFTGSIQISGGTCPFSFLESTTNNLSIGFSNAGIITQNGNLKFSGTILRTDVGPKIFISPGSIVSIQEKVLWPIVFSGNGNLIQGSPDFQDKIYLNDINSTLEIKILSNLNKNIVLNNGSILLSADLTLKENVWIEGSGIIDLANYGFMISSNSDPSAWTGNLIFKNATNITIKRDINPKSTWEFNGENKKSSITGFNNSIDLSEGIFKVSENHKLILNSTRLRGLGDSHNIGLDLTTTSTLEFQASTLELNEDVSISSGTIIFSSGNCSIESKNRSCLHLTGDAKLIIDGVVVQYNSFANIGVLPITTNSPSQIIKINGGGFAPGGVSTALSDMEFALPASSGINAIDCSIELVSQRQIHFINENPTLRKQMIFDGNGNKIVFLKTGKASFILDPNIDLIINNSVFDAFDPIFFNLQGDESTRGSITFNNNVIWRLKNDVNLLSCHLNITGDLKVEGNSYCLGLNDNVLTLSPNATFNLSSVTLKTLGQNPFLHVADSGTIQFNNSILLMTQNCNITTGSILFSGTSKITSPIASNQTFNNSNLVFQSDGFLTIAENSILTFDRGTAFIYNPNTTNDSLLSEKRRHIKMLDHSSRLSFYSAMLSISSSGIAFDRGIIDIDGLSIFRTDKNSTDSILEIGQDVNFNINQEAIIDGVLEAL